METAGTIYSLAAANQTLMQVVTNNNQPQPPPQQLQQSNAGHRSGNSSGVGGNSNDLHSTSNSSAAAFNPLAVIDHLQQSLRQEQTRRVELEKELLELRRKYVELQNQVSEHGTAVQKVQEIQRVQLDSVKKRLLRTLKSSVPQINDSNYEDIDDRTRKRIEYLHECDECTFRTKSDVSLILHKMNHIIKDQQYILSTSSFTTRNSNSKSIYQCSACDTKNLTRHQVYRHIYDVHTTEKPLCCPYCELSFTHRDYLAGHIPAKHDKVPVPRIPQNHAISLESSSTGLTTTFQRSSSPSSSSRNENPSSGSGSKPHRGRIVTAQPSASNQTPSTTAELKCTFPDCNFVTNFSDKLEFHMKAHVTTKYKCPYCPYVSNTIVDIKRHIQKSKKHEGLKMYSCQKCGYAADCDRAFKEHLRAYHFGYEAHEQIIEYFIEEMFSNKNAKRSEDEDGNSQSEAIAMLLNSSNGSSSGPISGPISSPRNTPMPAAAPPPAKKQATVTKNSPGRMSSSAAISNVNNQKVQQRHQVQGYRSTPSNPTSQPTPQHQTLNIQLPLGTNPNAFTMYHGLELATVEHGVNFVAEDQNNLATIRSSMSHHHNNDLHQQQQLQQQPRQASSTSQTAQQQATGNSSGGNARPDAGGGGATGIPNSAVTLSQYVSYANY